jgi:hypothetical protein
MSKKFLKKADLQLINGGYLSDKNENPVSNAAFVAAQKHAEYVVTFAVVAKGKDFVGKKADSLQELETQVRNLLAVKNRTFVEKPNLVAGSLTAQLKEEALLFMNFQENVSKVDKINNFLKTFEVVAEFEEFGLFFEEEVVKLNRIYTIKEIVEAVSEVIDLLK